MQEAEYQDCPSSSSKFWCCSFRGALCSLYIWERLCFVCSGFRLLESGGVDCWRWSGDSCTQKKQGRTICRILRKNHKTEFNSTFTSELDIIIIIIRLLTSPQFFFLSNFEWQAEKLKKKREQVKEKYKTYNRIKNYFFRIFLTPLCAILQIYKFDSGLFGTASLTSTSAHKLF